MYRKAYRQIGWQEFGLMANVGSKYLNTFIPTLRGWVSCPWSHKNTMTLNRISRRRPIPIRPLKTFSNQ